MKSERQDRLANLPAWNSPCPMASACAEDVTVTLYNQRTDHDVDTSISNTFSRLSINKEQGLNDIDKSLSPTHDFDYTHSKEEEFDRELLFLPDDDGDTRLHISIMQEDDLASMAVIRVAPDFVCLNIPNNLGQTPMHLAALVNSPNIVRKLVCTGGDITHQDMQGNTPLHLACSRGYLEVVKQLLRHITYSETVENKYPIPFVAIPQNMNMKNFDGLSCLHLAVLARHGDIVRLLMECEADVNFGDGKSGRTPLHMAAEQGMIGIAAILLSYSTTNVNMETYAGHTPAQLAYSRGHLAMTELLCRHGASFLFFYSDNSESSDENDML